MTHCSSTAALITLLAITGFGSFASARSEDGTDPARNARHPGMPSRPLPRRKLYEPDQAACRAETIESAYHRHLRPWADQPDEVQERLRRLQGELTRRSLRRCIDKGLMSRDEATAVERRLDLPSFPQAAAPASGLGPAEVGPTRVSP